MLAELEMTFENGVQYSVLAPETEMRKLSISLAGKMRSGVREIINVRGLAYHNGVPYPITLNIRTDQLVGSRLRSAEPQYGSKDKQLAGVTSGGQSEAQAHTQRNRSTGKGMQGKEGK